MSRIPQNIHLPEPKECNCCGSKKVRFINNSILFNREVGEWPYLWHCDDCEAYVGVHPDTRSPMGLLADTATRKARRIAHRELDKIWKKAKLCTRTQAYASLAAFMKMTRQEAHIAMFDEEQCLRAAEWAKSFRKEWQSKKKEKSVYRAGRKIQKRTGTSRGNKWSR